MKQSYFLFFKIYLKKFSWHINACITGIAITCKTLNIHQNVQIIYIKSYLQCAFCSIKEEYFLKIGKRVKERNYKTKKKLIYLYFPPSSQLLYLCFCPVGLSLL